MSNDEVKQPHKLNPRSELTLMLLVVEKKLKMTEILARGFSSESTQRELSNKYQNDRVNI